LEHSLKAIGNESSEKLISICQPNEYLTHVYH